MHSGLGILAATAALALAAAPAHAMVTISSAATQNMSCSGGICTPTAKSAVLNAGDLETLLASGSVEVTTTGTGVQARDVDVKAAVAWSSGSVLTLDAYRSIAIDQPVSVTGPAGLVLDTSDGNKGKGGALTFGKNGNVTFASLSSSLTINSAAYTLVGDIKTLASDIAANPDGNFALANSYDAGGDGTYSQSVVPTEYFGTFTGLGNAISNLSIVGQNENNVGNGLFAEVGSTGVLENISVINADIVATFKAKNVGAGPLAGVNFGTIMFAYATGSVTVGADSSGGGLVGGNAGTIANSYAADAVTGKAADIGGLVALNFGVVENSYAVGKLAGGGSVMGGLVADNSGVISNSFATGAIIDKGITSIAGGLVGRHEEGVIENSYATGSVTGGENDSASFLGGLVGVNDSTISFSYSTGSVTGNAESDIGGLIGADAAQPGSLTDTYWDTDTSGVSNLGQGAGNIADDPGITGLTTAQFQSGLPQGFDPSVWAENPNIDGGLPYLIANPPPK